MRRRSWWVAAPPADLRHPHHLLPLLPSGPGGVCRLASRRNRRSHHDTCMRNRCGMLKLAERAGFEPAKRFDPLTHFPGALLQPLGHLSMFSSRTARCAAGGMVRRLLRLSPRSRSGPALRLSQFVPDELVEPAKRFDPLTHFPGALLQPLGHLSMFSSRTARCAAGGMVRRLLRLSPCPHTG